LVLSRLRTDAGDEGILIDPMKWVVAR